jgi:hypothetical protein
VRRYKLGTGGMGLSSAGVWFSEERIEVSRSGDLPG